MRVGVIGGGVSGVISAIELSKKGHQVSLFEKNDRCLKKLLITGNGRCNFSNSSIQRNNFHGDKKFIDSIFSDDFTKARDYIIDLGIIPYTDERNRIYPMSLQAQSVVEVLLRELDNSNVEVYLNSEIISIDKNKKFILKTNDNSYEFDKIVFSSGSMSYPNMGTDGTQYKLVEKLGHTKTKLYPGIGPLVTRIPFNRELKGLKVTAKITAMDKINTGDLLFTENGISGNAIFELSSYILRNKINKIFIDFLPEIDVDSLKEIIKNRLNNHVSDDPKWILNGIIHKRLYKVLFKILNIKNTGEINVDLLVKLIKVFEVENIQAGSWALSQITVGGINTNEIDLNLQSKIVDGLYFTGEVIDVDGDCGGYNLTWAIYSALLVSDKLR